jgi:hypothetical protein
VVLRCYEARIKPALHALAQSGAWSNYRFGHAEYIEHVVGIAPVVGKEKDPSAGAAAKRSYLGGYDGVKIGMPADLLRRTTILGDASLIADETTYDLVFITLTEPGTPVDGGMDFVCFVDRSQRTIVFVMRVVHG